MVKVLFVCFGNICRSPMAEAVFADLVRQAGLEGSISIDSAGISDLHEGETAHEGTLDVLKSNKIEYNGRSRPVTPQDLETFDYIVAMDNANKRDLLKIDSANNKLSLLLDYAPQISVREVPDPYYDGTFENVYWLVLTGNKGLLDQLRHAHTF